MRQIHIHFFEKLQRAHYLRHENYNKVWSLGVKLFTVCFLQMQNLQNSKEIMPHKEMVNTRYSNLTSIKNQLTDLANSITEICIPKQIPRYGTLFSLAYFAANIIPLTPRSPNPPGTKTHAAPCKD